VMRSARLTLMAPQLELVGVISRSVMRSARSTSMAPQLERIGLMSDAFKLLVYGL